eukprot:1458319-Prymnesium_polylepis.2
MAEQRNSELVENTFSWRVINGFETTPATHEQVAGGGAVPVGRARGPAPKAACARGARRRGSPHA